MGSTVDIRTDGRLRCEPPWHYGLNRKAVDERVRKKDQTLRVRGNWPVIGSLLALLHKALSGQSGNAPDGKVKTQVALCKMVRSHSRHSSELPLYPGNSWTMGKREAKL